MILLLDVQRKSIVVAGGMKKPSIWSHSWPNGYFVDMPHEKNKRRHELGNRFFD